MHFTLCLGPLFILLTVSEALLQFDKSVLFDQKDLFNQNVIVPPFYCTEACEAHGCHIYVSIAAGSEDVAKNIIFAAGDNFKSNDVSLFDASNARDADGRKIPIVYAKGTPTMLFLNSNVGFKTAPLAVWIVFGNSPLFNIVDVYDGADKDRTITTVAGIVTILGVEPYELSVIADGPLTSFTGIMAGFDALDSSYECQQIIREENAYQDVRFAPVRSPLLTLTFTADNNTRVRVFTEKMTHDTLALGSNMFVTSPGYIGCSSNNPGILPTKNFYSSLYEAESEAQFISTDPVSVVLSSHIFILDRSESVKIIADEQPPIKWSGIVNRPLHLTAKELTITWTRNNDYVDQFFMIRVEPDNTPTITTVAPTQMSSVPTQKFSYNPETVKPSTAEPRATVTEGESVTATTVPLTTTGGSTVPCTTSGGRYGSTFVSIILAATISI